MTTPNNNDSFSVKPLLPFRKLFCYHQHLIRLRADANVLGEVHPADNAGSINQELGRPRNVGMARSAFGVQQVVAADGLCFRIREKRKGIACTLAELSRLFNAVNADRYGTNTSVLELLKVLLNAS